jgi:tetratricopeptide (TPR) repeat protein
MGRSRTRRTEIYRLLAVLVLSATPAVQSEQSPEQLYKDATAAYDRGDVTRAISLYEQLLKLQPNSVAVRSELGVALVHQGRYSEAVEQYREALRREPENATVKLNLALAWYKQAAFDKAAVELESLRVKQPNNPQSLHLLADCYLRLGRNAEVITLLQPVREISPNDLAVAYALGTALIREKQISQAEVVLDPILRKKDSPEANLLMGEAQFEAGDYERAERSLRTSVEVNPQVAEAWSLYGRMLLHKEDKQGAVDAFQHALRLDPTDFGANLYMGSVLRSEGKSEEAMAYAGKAIQLRPSSPEARFEVAALNARLGKLDQARTQFEDLERDWPEFLEVHVQLAVLYSRLNLKERSEHEREIVMKLNEKAREETAKPHP